LTPSIENIHISISAASTHLSPVSEMDKHKIHLNPALLNHKNFFGANTLCKLGKIEMHFLFCLFRTHFALTNSPFSIKNYSQTTNNS